MDLLLDCRNNLEQLHEQLAQTLRFPDWYGKNLDALHDCLNDVSQPVALTVLFGELQPNLLRVLTDCAAENPNISLIILE